MKFDFTLRIACPAGLLPPAEVLDWARRRRPRRGHRRSVGGVDGADCVTTDTWISMGDDDSDRHNLLAPYRVDEDLMAKAKPGALFMHCLPAHRGEKGPTRSSTARNRWFGTRENRLHASRFEVVSDPTTRTP